MAIVCGLAVVMSALWWICMNTIAYNMNTGEYTLLLEKDNAYLKEKVDELVKLLNQEQSLHLQTQQQLPGKVEEETKRKRWWQFRK